MVIPGDVGYYLSVECSSRSVVSGWSSGYVVVELTQVNVSVDINHHQSVSRFNYPLLSNIQSTALGRKLAVCSGVLFPASFTTSVFTAGAFDQAVVAVFGYTLFTKDLSYYSTSPYTLYSDTTCVRGTAGVPTSKPVGLPTSKPVGSPTSKPVGNPTSKPVAAPTLMPVGNPTLKPVGNPTSIPVIAPTSMPVQQIVDVTVGQGILQLDFGFAALGAQENCKQVSVAGAITSVDTTFTFTASSSDSWASDLFVVVQSSHQSSCIQV